MKVLVASALKAGETRAAAINTVKMAEGFARAGHEVLLVTRQASGNGLLKSELSEVYGIEASFEWEQLPEKLGSKVAFGLAVLKRARKFSPDLVFARNNVVPTITSLFGFPSVIETHAHVGQRSLSFRLAVLASRLKPFRVWITIGEPLARYYQEMGVPETKVRILPTGVNINRFSAESAGAARNPYADNSPNVCYVGHLYDYKGIPTILQAARQLQDVNFHLVGGTTEDIARQRKNIGDLGITNVTLHGHKSQSQLPAFMWYADILLLPPSADHPSAAWTSPVKLGEYMASGTPIVASRISALDYWLTEDEVEFVEPDNGERLAQAIKNVLEDKQHRGCNAEKALEKAKSWSYECRAGHIVEASMNEIKPSSSQPSSAPSHQA